MKGINYLLFRKYIDTLIYVILAFTSCSAHTPPPCGLYGAPPCQFLPAPPGQTPSCARPGKTYCEHIDNYPTYLIKHLVQKWGYEAKNLLIDETWDDFSALSWHESTHFYDPAFIFGKHNFDHDSDVHVDFNGYKYNAPPPPPPSRGNAATSNAFDHVQNAAAKGGAVYPDENSLYVAKTTEQPTFLLYSSSGQQTIAVKKHLQHLFRTNTATLSAGPSIHDGVTAGLLNVTPNNPGLWLKRFARELNEQGISVSTSISSSPSPPRPDPQEAKASSKRNRRDVSLNLNLFDVVGVERDGSRSSGSSSVTSNKRVKRQSPGKTSLCQTTSQFVTPQAALNSNGNWMFVVNEMNTARQMVKTELCASSTCSNLCQLPNAYSSRCEQKFVQKRLIALQANGQNLYTDTFWFPSCCVCTVVAN